MLVHTGWGSLWLTDDKVRASAPGVGLDAARYLVEKEVVLVARTPRPPRSCRTRVRSCNPGRQLLIPRDGIYVFENLVTEELTRDRAYRFALFYAPLKLEGATDRRVTH